jgi:catechol 2,3-dioxygenase-like lactoylglutathione lyase family enzyme
MRTLVTNLLTRDVERCAAFYRLLCGLTEVRRTESYVLFAAADGESFQIAVIDWVSELVPRAARGLSAGAYLTFVLEDVGAALAIARDFELEVVEETPSQPGSAPIHAVLRDIDGRIVELVIPAAHLALAPQQRVA